MVVLLLGLGCASPVDGALSAGTYGEGTDGNATVLVVAEDGTGELGTGCSSADLGALVASDGHLHVAFSWTVGGGIPDSGRQPIPATLDADVTARHITGTIANEGSDPYDVDLVRGVAPELYACP